MSGVVISNEFAKNGVNAAGSPVIRGSFCIIENSVGGLCFVLEKEGSWWKRIGHIGIPGGRAEELAGGVLENATETIMRELPQESNPLAGWENKLIIKGVVNLINVLNETQPIEVAVFSLFSEFETVDNHEVKGVVLTKQQLLEYLQKDDGYLNFRPLVLEAVALHFGVDLEHKEKQIVIAGQNYATKPERTISALVDIFSRSE